MNKKKESPRPLSGSKPKKMIKYTRHNNPSLASMQLTSLFQDHEGKNSSKFHSNRNVQNMMKESQSELKKVKSVAHLNEYGDSLTQAEKLFTEKKMEKRNESQSRRASLPQLVSTKYSRFDSEIKLKQKHGYNIINCYPEGY